MFPLPFLTTSPALLEIFVAAFSCFESIERFTTIFLKYLDSVESVKVCALSEDKATAAASAADSAADSAAAYA